MQWVSNFHLFQKQEASDSSRSGPGWKRMTEGWKHGGCGEPEKPPIRSGRRNRMAEGNKIYQIALKFCLHGILSLNWAQVSPFYYIDYGKDN